MKKQLLWTKKS